MKKAMVFLLGMFVGMIIGTVTIPALNRHQIGSNNQTSSTNAQTGLVYASLAQTIGRFRSTPDGFVVTYAVYRQQPVELISEQGRLTLRIKMDASLDSRGQDEMLEYMKWQVEQLSQEQVTPMYGGYTIVFNGQWPLWNPYDEVGPNGHFKCLYFANGATYHARANTITCQVATIKPNTYYPYVL